MRQTNESNWNMIEIVNSDPMLSEFKYHFYLRNCFIPRHMKIKEIAQKIYKGFKLPQLTPHSIYMVQIIKVHQQTDNSVDLAVGFRRDQVALKIARQVKVFQFNQHLSKIQLSPGFQVFVEDLKSQSEMLNEEIMIPQITQIPIKRQESQVNNEKSQEHKNLKEDDWQIKNKPEQMKEESDHSQSRSRQKFKKKKNMLERLTNEKKVSQELQTHKPTKFKCFLLLTPIEAQRSQILNSIQGNILNVKDIFSYDWKRNAQIPYFQIVVNRRVSYEKLIYSGYLKIQHYKILILGETQKIVEQLQARQAVYYRSTQLSLQKEEIERKIKERMRFLEENIKRLKWIREMNVMIVNITELSESEYIVTFSHDLERDISRVRIENWQVQESKDIRKFRERPTLKNLWYKYKNQK